MKNDDIQSANTISYKMPNSTFSINMPKVATMGTITLFNGKFTNCKAFWVFYDNISMNTIMRENIKVQYYINNKKKVLVLKNAWPTNIERNIYRFFRNMYWLAVWKLPMKTLLTMIEMDLFCYFPDNKPFL